MTLSRIIRGGGFGYQNNPNQPNIVRISENGEIIRDVVDEVEDFEHEVFDEEEQFEETDFQKPSPQEIAEEEAKRIIDDATRKAKGLITQAKMEARNIKINAKEVGYKEGFASGVEKIGDSVKEFEDNIIEIQEAQKEFIEDFENTVVSFAIEISNEIMRREIEVDPFALCEMVDHAMHTVREAKWAVVTLSKKLMPMIELLRSELASKHQNIESIDVVGTEIDIAECNIDTPNGRIELSILTQLDNLIKRFEMLDKE